MTKTAKEILAQHFEELIQPQRLDPIRENTARQAIEGRVDQALKELEAIMQGVIGNMEQLHYIDQDKDPDDYLVSQRSARNELRYDQRQKLKEALYGEEKL